METNLAKRLKELRALRAMSQEYLAEEARVSLRTVQRIENNESVPTGETIKRISTALGVELKELVGMDSIIETSDLKAAIIFLKKKRSQTNVKSEIKTFEKFIQILNRLEEKELTRDQIDSIESYIQYLELEKIPSFSNEIFKAKLILFNKYLKKKLKFVPNHFYTMYGVSFSLSFAIAFGMSDGIEFATKTIVISGALTLIALGLFLDSRISNQGRSFSF